jgi:hypothetical protein
MVSERLKILFGKVKKGLSEIKPEDIAKFAAKEVVEAIPVVGQIIKDAFDEFAPDEKEELIKELKELSESQFRQISEKIGVSVEYLKDIRGITLYTFEELRADHEEIKELIRSLIEIQIGGEINIPTIQSVLRKEETTEGDFFKKEPEWIDFEEGFVVERKEVNEIIKKLEYDNIQLVLGEPASGKSVILKNIGFKLANENKDVYIVELKKHSKDEVKRYFEDIPEIKDEKAVFIVDDAHLLSTECERLVRDFKNRKLKAKLIIGSRPTREIRGEHPKEASEFEYVSKIDIRAEDVTEGMVRRFLKRKYDFSDERIKTVSKNLEKGKKDLWHLSWALKAYNPEKDSVEEEEICEKIRDSIRKIKVGKDETGGDVFLNAEDIFLPLSVFYRFEIPIERDFLEEQLEIEVDKINKLIGLSEIIEREGIGRNRMLSLIHSSIAELYFGAYQAYPSLGRETRKNFQGDISDMEYIEYCLFRQYMKSKPTNSFDVVIYLERDWYDEKGGRTLLERMIEDEKIENLIKESTGKEEDIEKIGSTMRAIAMVNKGIALKLANHIDIDFLASKIEKEEDIEKIGVCIGEIVVASEEVGLKLVNCIGIDALSLKIGKEKDIEKIGWYMNGIALGSEEAGLELVNCNFDVLASKIEKEEDIGKIVMCTGVISGIVSASESDEGILKLFTVLLSKNEKRCKKEVIELRGDKGKYTIEISKESVRKVFNHPEIVNRLNPKLREELRRWLK